MAFTEDLSYIEDATTGFAVAATYNGSTTVYGIFDNEYAEASNVQGSNPTFTIKTSAIASPAHGDTLVISGTTYKIRGVEPDGTGVTRLQLERQ